MRTLGARALAALLLAIVVAGCGVTTTSGTAKATVPRPTATAKATPYPTFDSTPQPTVAPGPCGMYNPTAQPPVQMGDLYVVIAFGLAYPSRKLPDDTPLAPLKLQATSGPQLDQQLPIEPLTNPSLKEPGGGFVLTVCNTSKTATHTLQRVSMRLDSFTAYTGQLNQWNLCDGTYTPPSPGSGGCGGGFAADEYLHATFTSTTVGATATVVESPFAPAGSGPNGVGGPLPISLKPNQLLTVNLGLTPPTAAGTYTFSNALTVDGAQTPFTPVMGPILLAPIAHKWGGQACTSAAMQSQMPPATNPPSAYICPEA